MENTELQKKLVDCEIEIAEQAKRFEQSEEEYQRKIDRLKSKIQLQQKDRLPLLRKQINNWIFFGVISSALPLAMNVSYILLIGFAVNLADVLADFVLVLFAISMNLLSILLDVRKSSITNFCIAISMVFIEFSFGLSFILSTASSSFSIPITRISTIFLIATISIIFEIMLGIIVIVLQNRISSE